MKIRTLRSQEREALLELLDGWELPDGWRGRDFFRRCLEVDPSYADDNVWVAEEEGRLVSCVQIFPRRLRVLGHPVPAGGIGSVYTAPERREKGLAGAILDRCAAAMKKRGMELSLLFSDRTAFYSARGWRSCSCQRTVLRRPDGGIAAEEVDGSPGEGELRIARFDWERDFEAVRAIHSAYSASRSGTVVRDAEFWKASFRLAGNPNEEFWVALRQGTPVAYMRVTLLLGIFMVTELGRLEDAAEALATLTLHMLEPVEDDPLAPPGKSSRELRSFVVLPAFDDIPFTVALERRRVGTHPVDDSTAMLRCLNVSALAARLDVSLLPGENGEAFRRRSLPGDSLVFWPADRF
jgi:predicted N-acetyltransferase YhbS